MFLYSLCVRQSRSQCYDAEVPPLSVGLPLLYCFSLLALVFAHYDYWIEHHYTNKGGLQHLNGLSQSYRGDKSHQPPLFPFECLSEMNLLGFITTYHRRVSKKNGCGLPIAKGRGLGLLTIPDHMKTSPSPIPARVDPPSFSQSCLNPRA